MSANNPHAESLNAEVRTTLGMYLDHGYEERPDISAAALLMGIGWAFVPEEMSPAEHMPGASPVTKRYFEGVVQPDLVKKGKQLEERTLALAHQLGRMIGAGVEAHMVVNFHAPLALDANTITADGQTIPYEVASGRVVEFGMGVNGLLTHVSNVKEGRYAVHAIHKTRAEVCVLKGAAEKLGLSEGLTAVDRGIPYRLEGLRRQKKVDADLQVGIARSADVVRPGGLVVARGPQKLNYSGFMDYNAVRDKLQANDKFEIVADHPFSEYRQSHELPEASRLVVARRR